MFQVFQPFNGSRLSGRPGDFQVEFRASNPGHHRGPSGEINKLIDDGTGSGNQQCYRREPPLLFAAA